MTKVTLVLAQGPGKPDGDIADRLVLQLCLTPQGQLDTSAYETTPVPWLATRSRNGQPPRTLEIIRIDEAWALQSTTSHDDPVWAFEGQIYRPGELVRLRRPEGTQMLFRIVATESDELESDQAAQ